MDSPTNKVLIVDDDRSIGDLLTRLLRSKYSIEVCMTGEEALEVIESFRPGLVLLDISLPGIDGYEICRILRASRTGHDMHIVMVSSKTSHQERLEAFEAGADDYIAKPFDTIELRGRVELHFRLLHATQSVEQARKEIAEHNSAFRELIAARTQELVDTQDVTVLTLARLAESRDQETGDHLIRLRAYAQSLAEQLRQEGPYVNQINQDFLEDLYRSSPLHDIGKVGIADAILLKPGRLTPEEFEVMKRHSVLGANILDQAVLSSSVGGFLAMAAVIARFHHERFNGTGYPAGLVGIEIPLPARIVALADVFDALTSVRSYKPVYSPEDTRKMILAESGKHFDPVIVEAFEARYKDFLQIQRRFADGEGITQGAAMFQNHDVFSTNVIGENDLQATANA